MLTEIDAQKRLEHQNERQKRWVQNAVIDGKAHTVQLPNVIRTRSVLQHLLAHGVWKLQSHEEGWVIFPSADVKLIKTIRFPYMVLTKFNKQLSKQTSTGCESHGREMHFVHRG